MLLPAFCADTELTELGLSKTESGLDLCKVGNGDQGPTPGELYHDGFLFIFLPKCC